MAADQDRTPPTPTPLIIPTHKKFEKYISTSKKILEQTIYYLCCGLVLSILTFKERDVNALYPQIFHVAPFHDSSHDLRLPPIDY